MPVYNPSEVPADPLQRRIYAALRLYPNTIAGRPNAGNLSLPLVQRFGKLPTSIFLDYSRRALNAFVPGLVFALRCYDTPTRLESWQGVEVMYAEEVVTSA